MNDNQFNGSGVQIPATLLDEARSFIEQGFELLRQQAKTLATDFEELDKRVKDVRERTNRGARRTTGKIV